LVQLPTISFINIIDMLVVAFLIYKLFLWIKGTRAVQLLKGLVVLLIATTVSNWLGLYTFNWILKSIQGMLIVAIPVVFQPELRRALERLGRGKFLSRQLVSLGEEDTTRVINEIVRGAMVLAKNKIGALIVFERETGINDYVETGVGLDSLVSGELLINIFTPNSPLHDGAVIVRNDRVVSAGCFLPLTEGLNISKELGTRHRAAIGVTEISDSLVIIVSEETGVISFAKMGRLSRYLDTKSLKEIIKNGYKAKEGKASIWTKRGSRNE